MLADEPEVRDRLVRKFMEMVDPSSAREVTEQAVDELRAIGYLR